MVISDEDVLRTALNWHAQGRTIAIATLIETWGSAPRSVGSQLVVDRDGRFEGSVSGGCVEADVIADALDVIADGRPRVREFGVTDEKAWQTGLSCGGQVKIFIERLMRADILAQLVDDRRIRRTSIVVTDIKTGAQRLLHEPEFHADDLTDRLREQIRRGRSALIEHNGASLFLHARTPTLRLIVVGAVHIAQALVPIAQAAAYEVIVIDPRSAFATEARFPHCTVIAEWPHSALANCAPDPHTAIIVLSHVPNIDDEALKAALASDCFYIGALGSRKTNAARLQRLREQNIPEAALARIHAPIGVDIGAVSPAEIAIAVIAEIIAARREKPPRIEVAA